MFFTNRLKHFHVSTDVIRKLSLYLQEKADTFKMELMDSEIDLKASRKLTLEWAKENLQGKTMKELQTGKQILFTGKGIKEAINQPHTHYLKKNKAITEILWRFPLSEFVCEMYDPERPDYSYRYYRTEIGEEDSFLVIRENWITGLVDFYSIVDKIKE